MIKKLFIIIVAILLLTSCSNGLETNIDNNENTDNIVDQNKNNDTSDGANDDTSDDIDSTIKKYTGELITDGRYSDSGSLVFVPDKETKEYIKNNFTFNFDESMYLTYDNEDVVKGLPAELGIYKVEIEPDIEGSNHYMKINSIKLTDKIGTVEYEGKTYETNSLDENVRVKDRVCGLIVNYVHFTDEKEGVMIRFSGELEVEGIYNLYNSIYHNNLNIGKIYADKKSLEKFPVYKNEPVKGDKFSIYFAETNDLYKEIANHSAVGRGKFKISDYYIFGGYLGTEFRPSEKLAEIISLDEGYKDMFKFSNESLVYLREITDKYFLVSESPNDENISGETTYYVVGRKNFSKINILPANGYQYGYEKTSDERFKEDEMFTLTTDGYNERTNTKDGEHIITYRFSESSYSDDSDVVIKELNYTVFKDGDGTKTIYEGQEFLGMKAEDISVLYYCFIDKPEELVQIRAQFSGETTVTGNISVLVNDPQYEYLASFYCDEEGSKNLPYPIEDTRSVWFIVVNENIQELLGPEAFEKECKLTIKNYYIHYSATEAANTAEIIKIEEMTE